MISIINYRIGVYMITLIRAKHFSSTTTAASFNHHNMGIQQCERNEGFLTSKLSRKQLTDKKKKDKSDKVYIGTQACKLFQSRFQMLCNAFIMKSTAKIIS